MKNTIIVSLRLDSLLEYKSKNPDSRLLSIFEAGNKSVALYPKSFKTNAEYLFQLSKNAVTNKPLTKNMPLPFSKGVLRLYTLDTETIEKEKSSLKDQGNIYLKKKIRSRWDLNPQPPDS